MGVRTIIFTLIIVRRISADPVGLEEDASSSVENCIRTLGRFDLEPDASQRINDNATVNKVTNLNSSNKGNYSRADAECSRIFRMDAVTDGGSSRKDIYWGNIADNSNSTGGGISSTGRTKLQFPACPSGETIVAESLQEHYLPFSIFSGLMGSLQPSEFPLGILRDPAGRRVPLHLILLQILKVEGLVLVWILSWAVLSLCIPCAVVAQICCPAKNLQRLEDHSSDSSLNYTGSVRRLAIPMHILLFLLIINLFLMLGSNEQLSKSITTSPARAETILEDLQRFIRNTEMQISFVTGTSIEYAADALEKDLEDVGGLIGAPLQENIAAEFPMRAIFQALNDIKSDSGDISRRVKYAMEECALARDAAEKLRVKLEEVVVAVEDVHRHCSQRDRSLCETLVGGGLDVTFRTEELTSDVKLKYLEGLASSWELNATLSEAEINYNDIPQRVAVETETQRAELRTSVKKQRAIIHKTLRSLESLSRSSISAVKTGGTKIVPLLQDIASRDVWRYLSVLVISIVTFLIWMCLMCGAPCGCENSRKAVPYLMIGLALGCLISLALWVMGSVSLLLGVHGHNLICASLEDPSYRTLTELLDDGGVLYKDGGFFKQMLRMNESLRTAEILWAAERNLASYKTFKLKNKLDIDDVTNYTAWQGMKSQLEGFHLRTKKLRLMPDKLESQLLDLYAATRANMTVHRLRTSKPLTARDLNGFLDMAYAVARQIADARTGNRVEKLIFTLRNIVNVEMAALRRYQDMILYHVTTLEVMLKPLNEKLEFVIRNLAIVQRNVMQDTRNISKTIVAGYTQRLEDYLVQFQQHVRLEVQHNVGRTRGLWKIFHATKISLCEELVDAINALSFSCHLSILLIICLMPIITRTIKHYREINEEMFNSIIHRSSPEERRPHWGGTPPLIPGTPETTRNLIDVDAEESSWASPRPPSDSRRNASPRPLIPTISKAITSRYDSLKMIERQQQQLRIQGSTTPRSWI